jgi:hypothetical protein
VRGSEALGTLASQPARPARSPGPVHSSTWAHRFLASFRQKKVRSTGVPVLASRRVEPARKPAYPGLRFIALGPPRLRFLAVGALNEPIPTMCQQDMSLTSALVLSTS